MTLPNPRWINWGLTLTVIGLMGYGLYSQYVTGLIPCPLCMTQRIFYCLIGGLAFIAAIHNHHLRLYSSAILLAAAGGIATAGRQTWLQHLPPEQVPACGPSLEYMLETFPFAETLKALILGDGNCAEVDWQFIGLSMAEWSLFFFIAFFIVCVVQILRRQQH